MGALWQKISLYWTLIGIGVTIVVAMANVKIYSTPTCPWCVKLKEFLTSKGVEFENIDVSTDQKAAEEMIDKSGQMGVPVTDINRKIIIGFDKEAIEKELG